jgi:hypothetical protein
MWNGPYTLLLNQSVRAMKHCNGCTSRSKFRSSIVSPESPYTVHDATALRSSGRSRVSGVVQFAYRNTTKVVDAQD